MSQAQSLEDYDLNNLQSEIERAVTKGDVEVVAVRKFIFALAGYPPGEPQPDDYDLLDATDDAIETLEELQELQTELEQVKSLAQQAYSLADRQAADEDDMSKKDKARILARDEAVKRAAIDASSRGKAAVTSPEVRNMARPDLELRSQTIIDAFIELEQEWTALEKGKNDDGVWRIQVDRSKLSEELTSTVEQSLDRGDLAKRLMSQRSSNRGS